MKNTKSAKIITLLVAIFLLVAAAFGIYALSGRNTETTEDRINAEPESVQQNTEREPITDINGEWADFTGDSLILLEGGTFTMGSLQDERQRGQDEVSHEVTIGAFYVDPYEVRQL